MEVSLPAPPFYHDPSNKLFIQFEYF